MKKTKYAGLFSVFFVAMYFIAAKPAYAYLDPGMGSFFVQILVAFLVSMMVFFKQTWAFIKGLIQKIFPGKKGPDSQSKDNPS